MSRRVYAHDANASNDQVGFRRGYLRGYREGHERGYQEGFRQGFQEVLNLKMEWEERITEYASQMEHLLEELRQLRDGLSERYREAVESYKAHLEDELGEIVALAAENYLNHALTQDPTLIKNVLRHSLDKFSGQYPIEVRANEYLFKEVEDFIASSDTILQRFGAVRAKLDRALGMGIVIDSEEGQVDARVQTLAKNLKALVQSVIYDNPENRVP
ncbi:hypothetical protein HPY42_01795 [Coprothermobacteraceae bacterium]|nr:hypothetical protein [Coprothermobacteraceae bacterium]